MIKATLRPGQRFSDGGHLAMSGVTARIGKRPGCNWTACGAQGGPTEQTQSDPAHSVTTAKLRRGQVTPERKRGDEPPRQRPM